MAAVVSDLAVSFHCSQRFRLLIWVYGYIHKVHVVLSPDAKAVYGTLFEAEHYFLLPILELSSSQMETDVENSSNVTTLISRKAQAEIDIVLGEGAPTNESLKKLDLRTEMTRERLRPCLVYAGGYKGEEEGHKVPKGTDIFISVKFEPDRFLRTKESNGIEDWAGFDPSRSPGALYPNEIIADFASLPFGGGSRKCIGEQFALMESTVVLTKVWNRFSLRI
ncbi:unnamed protein product [Brassica oleracea var. botrytis]